MKTIEIPYGTTRQLLHVPEERLSAVIHTRPSETVLKAPGETVQEALEHPIESERLCELSRNARKILIISSDHTRPVPSRVTMPLLLKEARLYNPQADITILIATGLHRPTTQAELLARFGEEIIRNEKIVVHNAVDEEGLRYFGTLPSGGELWLNKLVAESDLVISEGFIEPHFFAGFSGGRKSILPGVASRKTVLYNHNAAFIADPRARQGILKDNPIHRDMLFAAQKAGLRFILNVLLNEEKQIVAAFAGDAEKAHLAGCERCFRQSEQQAVVSDIAITSNGGYPLDQNIYQGVKGMTAAESCVRQGGAIILCAALGDGNGGERFYRYFADAENAAQVMRDIEGVPMTETIQDQWQAQILARVMLKAECWFVTGAENREPIENMHMHWAETVDEALAQATAMLGENSSVTVIPDGVGIIFPES